MVILLGGFRMKTLGIIIGNSNYRYRPNGEYSVVQLKESWYKYDELVFKLHKVDYDVNIPVKVEFLKWCLEINNTNTLFGNYYCFFQLIAMKIDKTKNNVNYITTDATTMSFIGFSGDLVEIYGVKYNQELVCIKFLIGWWRY